MRKTPDKCRTRNKWKTVRKNSPRPMICDRAAEKQSSFPLPTPGQDIKQSLGKDSTADTLLHSPDSKSEDQTANHLELLSVLSCHSTAGATPAQAVLLHTLPKLAWMCCCKCSQTALILSAVEWIFQPKVSSRLPHQLRWAQLSSLRW